MFFVLGKDYIIYKQYTQYFLEIKILKYKKIPKNKFSGCLK